MHTMKLFNDKSKCVLKMEKYDVVLDEENNEIFLEFYAVPTQGFTAVSAKLYYCGKPYDRKHSFHLTVEKDDDLRVSISETLHLDDH